GLVPLSLPPWFPPPPSDPAPPPPPPPPPSPPLSAPGFALLPDIPPLPPTPQLPAHQQGHRLPPASTPVTCQPTRSPSPFCHKRSRLPARPQGPSSAFDMSGREVREYTNLSDPKDRKSGKGKDKIDDEDVTFQRMVAKKFWLSTGRLMPTDAGCCR
uniref:Uncharacterized protein n=1 Tax=Triticum urartu TaxID=4572 RepID=A0A8R7UGT3_TRIUA